MKLATASALALTVILLGAPVSVLAAEGDPAPAEGDGSESDVGEPESAPADTGDAGDEATTRPADDAPPPTIPAPEGDKPAAAKPEEEKKAKVDWLLKGGAILTTGNARTFTLSAGSVFGVEHGKHKFGAEGGIAYVRSGMLLAVDDDPAGAMGEGTIEEDEILRDGQVTSSAWFLKARYDYFFIKDFSAYVGGNVGADRPAGKAFFGGGGAGLSYRLYKDDHHELVGELGYDFSYEGYVDETVDPNDIHSLRAFLGYKLKVGENTAIYANLEGLFNLNNEDVPTANGDGVASAFEDTRITGKAGLSTKLWKNLAFSFGFTAKYDSAPAPVPAFALPFAAGFVPLSDKLDTITEASLVMTLL